MEYYVKSVVPIIESNYDKFTPVEKQIANFFIHNQKKMDFSIKHISELLFTSKAVSYTHLGPLVLLKCRRRYDHWLAVLE